MENELNKPAAPLSLTIDEKKFEWPKQYITGSEIRKLAGIAADAEIFLKIKEPWTDELITDQSNVDLARPGIEHFYSKTKVGPVTLIVNGREKAWNEKEISFEQVITLAFGSYVENRSTSFTVTYSKGPHQNREGSMVKGDKIFVKNKMVFNVTATDKS